MIMADESLINKIVENGNAGKVTYMTEGGIRECDLGQFIDQFGEGILYDLNRDRATILALARNSKTIRWINDYAAALVIEALADKVEKYKKVNSENCEGSLKEYSKLKEENVELKKEIETLKNQLSILQNSSQSSRIYVDTPDELKPGRFGYEVTAEIKTHKDPSKVKQGFINTDFELNY
jgi:hypothetical protein